MRRVVLLGGSNVSRGISIIVETARRIVGGPADFLIAMGHGRSYGQRSSILGRGLPGITECGLWDALRGSDGETFAAVTDIGNDVGYGVPVDVIAGWVESCLERLSESRAQVVMTVLPLDSLRRLSPWHFHVARAILYPGRPVSRLQALERVVDLDVRLRSLGKAYGAAVIEHDLAWYGFDPVHIRRWLMAQAWLRILGPWLGGGPAPDLASGSPARWLRLRTTPPQRWWLLGRELGHPQPAGRLSDGSTIGLF